MSNRDDESTQCSHPACEEEGDEWEIVEGQWCYDHVPQPGNVPQEWQIN